MARPKKSMKLSQKRLRINAGKMATLAQYPIKTSASQRVQRGINFPSGNTYAQSIILALPTELKVGINHDQPAGIACKVRDANPKGDIIKANEASSAIRSSGLRQKSNIPMMA